MTSTIWKDETVVGGIFEIIKVEGNVEATSSVEANEMMIEQDSTLKIDGKLNVPYLKVNGELVIEGTLETNELVISDKGYLVVQGEVIVKTIDNKGTLDLKRGLKADDIQNKGAFIGMGPVKSTLFNSKGSIRLDEELNAEHITIAVAEVSNIRYIMCDDITVRAERENIFFKNEDTTLTVREIDAVNASVENLICDLCRADDVMIKGNCSIKAVEYVNEYHYNESSNVLEFVKITRN